MRPSTRAAEVTRAWTGPRTGSRVRPRGGLAGRGGRFRGAGLGVRPALRHLVRTVTDPMPASPSAGRRGRDRADDVRVDRRLLSLEHQPWSRLDVGRRRQGFEGLGADEDAANWCLFLEPGCNVDRVADDG